MTVIRVKRPTKACKTRPCRWHSAPGRFSTMRKCSTDSSCAGTQTHALTQKCCPLLVPTNPSFRPFQPSDARAVHFRSAHSCLRGDCVGSRNGPAKGTVASETCAVVAALRCIGSRGQDGCLASFMALPPPLVAQETGQAAGSTRASTLHRCSSCKPTSASRRHVGPPELLIIRESAAVWV